MFKRTPLAQWMLVALAAAPMAFAQEQEATEIDEENIDRIEVTGTRIKRTDMETVSPIYVIDAEDLKKQGFANVYDALDSLSQNTGTFIGEENTNNFNANAQSLNLRGFGPGYTLVLLDGRRMPVLPKPAGAVAGNVVNLATIPTAAVERIEVLTGGASAIYGSDAVAGVVNIITKKGVDFTDVSYRYGDTKDGGGQSNKFSLVSGNAWENTNLTFGVEVDLRDPIHGDDRDWFDEPTDSPDPSQHSLSQVMSYWDRYNPYSWMLKDLSGECEAQGYESVQPGWLSEEYEADPDPYYCGDNVFGEYTIRNGRDNYSGFLNMQHQLSDTTEFFFSAVGFYGTADAGLYRYGYGVDYDVYDDISTFDGFQGSRHMYRQFRDWETPTSNQTFDEYTGLIDLGLRGTLADEYEYTVALSGGYYDYTDEVVRFNDEAMLTLMFGEKGVDWDQPWAGARWVVVNSDRVDDDLRLTGFDLFGDLSPEMFNDVIQTSEGKGKSWNATLSADLTGDLMTLPAGPLQFAVVGEFQREGYEFITDEATVNGDLYGWSGISGKGDRGHYAIGAEFLIPVLDNELGKMELQAAGRYDYYDDDSSVDGAFTWGTGLTYRPVDQLMLRGNYATSFRAPDLHYLYADRSSSYSTAPDYYACRQDGVEWDNCSEQYTVYPRQYAEGNLDLEEETGYSAQVGFVADITDGLSLVVDYYKIKLENQVGILGSNAILRYEAECRTGEDRYGNPVDINSAKCQDMISRVTRGGGGGGANDTPTEVLASAFNTGLREQTGIDAAMDYKVDTSLGEFSAKLSWTHILSTKEAYLPEDEVTDVRNAQWNNEFRTQTNLTLGWSKDDAWVSTYIYRKGTSPVASAPEYERYDAWTTVNLSGGYTFGNDLYLQAAITNLFDEKPPQAESDKYWPYADISKYSAVGMEYFVTVGYRF
ncbi:TonB-dependent receptor [Marinobacter hydrocarbonoclasticus]|nr:TonB-dependent receptor [Marinobacter nauticus]